MGWTCQVCGKDHGGTKTETAPKCFEKPECKKKGDFACVWKEAKAPEWKFETGKLTKPTKATEALDDLNKLLKSAGNVYSSTIGTVVGGDAIKKGKKIKGLNDPNARIDIQSPISSGTYNVQYQIGTASAACVIFTGDDEEKDVFDNLRKSLKQTKKAISPHVEKK